jgi:hypothetical protein
MSKMGSHHPFEHLKHKLWSKERSRVKLTIWLSTIKSRELIWFLACRQRATYCWKNLNKGYNFSWNLIAIGGLHAKLWAPKVAGIQVVGISGLPLGNPKTKRPFGCGPVESCKVYYKGVGGGFPQVRAMVSFVNPSCPWLVLAPKVFQLCTNHLVLVLCKFVWAIEICQFFLVPSRSSNTPLYPSKMLRAREWAPTHYSSVVFSLDSHLSPSRSWEHVKSGMSWGDLKLWIKVWKPNIVKIEFFFFCWKGFEKINIKSSCICKPNIYNMLKLHVWIHGS